MSKLKELEQAEQDALDACRNYDYLIGVTPYINYDKVRADPERHRLGSVLITASTELHRYKTDYQSRLNTAKETVIEASKAYCKHRRKHLENPDDGLMHLAIEARTDWERAIDALELIESEGAE